MDKDKLTELGIKFGLLVVIGVPATALAKTLTNLSNEHLVEPTVKYIHELIKTRKS